MHFSIASGVAFSSFIKSLHFSNNFSIYSFLYIWKTILMAIERIFSSFILKIIFHNLSNPVNSSIFLTSIISYSASLFLSSFSIFSFIFIFSLFISKNKAINSFICSGVISLCLFSEIISNKSFLIFSFLAIVLALIFSLLEIYFFTKS